MSIRGNIANRFSGGPQYQVLPNRLLVEIQGETSLSELVERADTEAPDRLQDSPVGDIEFDRVESALNNLGSNTKRLDNLGVLVVEIPDMENFIKATIDNSHIFDGEIPRLESMLESAKESSTDTVIGGFGPGILNFGGDVEQQEASLMNELIDSSLSNPLTYTLETMNGVLNVEMTRTQVTFGPRSLKIDPFERQRRIFDEDPPNGEDPPEGEDPPDSENGELTTLGDVADKLSLEDAWKVDSGQSAIVAIFDTSFCEDAFADDRIIDSFSGKGVESAFAAPEEGHGTMCAYCAAGNEEDYKHDYSGIAKDADLLLARVSGSTGSLSFMAEAWDWLIGTIKELDRPVISNHSYGNPVCSARGMNTCNTLISKMAQLANQRSDHQAFYAAGNEAQYCGHRLSGITNGINGINSDTTSIASAALRYDLQDAQSYSSHGFGTCTNAGQNPKPDIGFLLPAKLPYGCEETDMSSGYGGSSGGTSAASPMNAGTAALVASITGTAKRAVIENIMESTAELPRATQINTFRGHDARFGNGQSRPVKAVERADKITIGPTAGFTQSKNVVEVGNTVTFDAGVTQTGDSNIETYNWDLGNGETATTKRINVQYEEQGNKDVTLTVTDNRGDTDSATRSITVAGDPEARIDVPMRTFNPDENITFDGSQSLNAVSYDWSFGDGTVGTGVENTYSYSEEGDYTVSLQVENNIGTIDIAEKTVRVDYPDPQATIETDGTEFDIGTAVEFDASNSQNAESYSWDMGDGTTQTGEVVNYSYGQTGQYTVSVEIENAIGETDTAEVSVTITDEQENEEQQDDGSTGGTNGGGGDQTEEGDGTDGDGDTGGDTGDGGDGEETTSGIGPFNLFNLGLVD